jgi:hypothetical protein
MTKNFVIVAADLHKQKDWNEEFRYRAYVNNELFVERTWIWDDTCFLEEGLQIEAPPGHYKIHFTVHGAHPEAMTVSNMRVVEGPGIVVDDMLVLE